MVTEEERQWMWQMYAPDPRMRLNLGIRRRLAPLLDNDRRKIELANSLLFTLPGSPILYYGDEIGMGDNIWLKDRDGVRTPMQWDNGLNAGFSSAPREALYNPVLTGTLFGPQYVNVADSRRDPGSLFNLLRRMIRVRKTHLAFSLGDFTWVDAGVTAVAAYLRSYRGESILCLNNVSGLPQPVSIHLPGLRSGGPIADLMAELELPEPLSGEPLSREPLSEEPLSITLQPYQYRWLRL
jgi:maltose alpha-D-glucosyltransferase/alpha-amylase